MSNKWISVKDRLPECGIDTRQIPTMFPRVLATNGERIEIVIYQTDRSNPWYIGCVCGDSGSTFSPEPYSYDEYMKNVTHWMLLPELPITRGLELNYWKDKNV